MKLKSDFYIQSAMELAPQLIGKLLCRVIDGKTIKLRITQTECYCGEEDTACHAHKGKTQRTSVMYHQGGCTYIYLCYGIHYLLNVVAAEKESPQAVLIRGVQGYEGPGKLTKALQINSELNACDLTTSDQLWIEDDHFNCKIQTATRIGIAYATQQYKEKLWRFILQNN